jgi:hypothetical protein
MFGRRHFYIYDKACQVQIMRTKMHPFALNVNTPGAVGVASAPGVFVVVFAKTLVNFYAVAS